MGFKNENGPTCANKNGDDLIQCIEEKSFSVNDTFPSKHMNLDVQLYYVDNHIQGLGQSIKIKPGKISRSVPETISLIMNPNISYYISIMDYKLQITSFNPDSVPRAIISLKENAGVTNFFLKVMHSLAAAMFILISIFFRL